MPNPRSRKLDVLLAIAEISASGEAPSVRAVCAALGISSTSTVHAYVEQLVRDGAIDRVGADHRLAIRLSEPEAEQVSRILLGAVGRIVSEIS